jgi:hypothetical protein
MDRMAAAELPEEVIGALAIPVHRRKRDNRR